MKLSSYLELFKVLKLFRGILSELNLNLDETIISLTGCRMVGIKFDDLSGYKWRTNHYLSEALGAEMLPDINEINKLKNNTENYLIEFQKLEK